MAKNNHLQADVKSRLDSMFFGQDFSGSDNESLSLERYLGAAAMYAYVEGSIAVLSDLKLRRSHLFYGEFASELGIAQPGTVKELDTIWEEEILSRIDEEDLKRKQADEMVFFSYMSRKSVQDNHFLDSCLRMRDTLGGWRIARHRIFYFRQDGAVRYALCIYTPATAFRPSVITNTRTGREESFQEIAGSEMVVSSRELEVLSLIARGLSSKEIAHALGISVYTVSRHRQNIIARMNVKNSTEACKMASMLGKL